MDIKVRVGTRSDIPALVEVDEVAIPFKGCLAGDFDGEKFIVKTFLPLTITGKTMEYA